MDLLRWPVDFATEERESMLCDGAGLCRRSCILCSDEHIDALSEALTAVRMTGAIFYHAECSAPWGFTVPALQGVAHLLAPGTERLVPYHLVTEGTALLKFDSAPILLEAGDVVIIPHGEGHVVSNGSPASLIDSAASLGQYLCGDLRTMRLGGGGTVTRFVCGYFGCERHADRLFLAGLPQLIKINVRGDATGEWLESCIRYLVCEADAARPGQGVLLSKMAEALFVQTLRRYMERLPPEQTGWLAGARDLVVGGALSLLHQNPSHAWSIEELARRLGTSRSVLAERFDRFLGEPPLTYLARWRAAASRSDAADQSQDHRPDRSRCRLYVTGSVQPRVQT